jgi:hypothetical protein
MSSWAGSGTNTGKGVPARQETGPPVSYVIMLPTPLYPHTIHPLTNNRSSFRASRIYKG